MKRVADPLSTRVSQLIPASLQAELPPQFADFLAGAREILLDAVFIERHLDRLFPIRLGGLQIPAESLNFGLRRALVSRKPRHFQMEILVLSRYALELLWVMRLIGSPISGDGDEKDTQ